MIKMIQANIQLVKNRLAGMEPITPETYPCLAYVQHALPANEVEFIRKAILDIQYRHQHISGDQE